MSVRCADAQIQVRKASAHDLDGVLDVQCRAPGRSATERFREQAADAITDQSLLFLVACVGENVIGWAMTTHFAEPDGPAPAGHYLMGVTVDPEWRRKGAGTLLVEARLDWIRERDKVAYFFANARNPGSIALHERWGFREIARGVEFRGVPFDGGEGVLFAAELREHENDR